MIIQARFTAVDHGTYSTYEVTSDGELAYGVLCDNSGHVDWLPMSDLNDAREYAALMAL